MAELEEHGYCNGYGSYGGDVLHHEEYPSEYHLAGLGELSPDYVERPVAGNHQGGYDTGQNGEQHYDSGPHCGSPPGKGRQRAVGLAYEGAEPRRGSLGQQETENERYGSHGE